MAYWREMFSTEVYLKQQNLPRFPHLPPVRDLWTSRLGEKVTGFFAPRFFTNWQANESLTALAEGHGETPCRAAVPQCPGPCLPPGRKQQRTEEVAEILSQPGKPTEAWNASGHSETSASKFFHLKTRKLKPRTTILGFKDFYSQSHKSQGLLTLNPGVPFRHRVCRSCISQTQLDSDSKFDSGNWD